MHTTKTANEIFSFFLKLKFLFWTIFAQNSLNRRIFSQFEQKETKQAQLQLKVISLLEKELVMWMPVLRSYKNFTAFSHHF